MIGRDLQDTDHVVRYVRPSLVRADGSLRSGAFRLRKNEAALSVNWVEYWSNAGISEPLDEIRARCRLRLSGNGRYAEMNVGVTTNMVSRVWRTIQFVHTPLEASDGYDADPSHAEVTSLPKYEDPESVTVANLIANAVSVAYPAVVV